MPKEQELLILQALPRIAIERFDDAQFFTEPRLRLLQRAFHDLRRATDQWAALGVMGAAAQANANTAPHLGEMLAVATMPRVTAHKHHRDQIQYALTMANDLGTIIASMGGMESAEKVPALTPYWCDLGQQRLGTRLLLDDTHAWLYVPYTLAAHAAQPVSLINMVQPQESTQRIACIVWKMPIPSERARTRMLEVAELGRWALRQPPYVPN